MNHVSVCGSVAKVTFQGIAAGNPIPNPNKSPPKQPETWLPTRKGDYYVSSLYTPED